MFDTVLKMSQQNPADNNFIKVGNANTRKMYFIEVGNI